MTAAMMSASLDDLLTDPAFYQDPYPVYARLREESPVHKCGPWGQWVVTRHADVARCLTDPSTFSSSGYEQRFLTPIMAEADVPLPAVTRHYGAAVLSSTDPPVHSRLRRLISGRFTPRVVAELAPRVRRLANELLDALAGRTQIDVVGDYAFPLPALVIGQLLGLPDDLGPEMVQWSATITNLVGTGSPDHARLRAAETALQGLHDTLNPIIEERRRRPGRDLLSLLTKPDGDGDRLTDDELVATCVVLLFAGHETTANLIGNAVAALLAHPEQLAACRRDPALLGPAVEETLRWDGSVQRVRRVVAADVVLGGRPLAVGDLVLAFLGSANRDPAVHVEPDYFNIRRAGPSHIGFGHGIHFCLGAALARMEAPIALTVLLERLPVLVEVPGTTLRRRFNLTFRGFESLPLSLSTGGDHR